MENENHEATQKEADNRNQRTEQMRTKTLKTSHTPFKDQKSCKDQKSQKFSILALPAKAQNQKIRKKEFDNIIL